jgi:ribosomal subunit interface protein
MRVLVSGKQIDVGESLRGQVESRLGEGIAKYFANPIDAHVVFSREGSGYRVDCSVHVGHGIHAQVHGEAPDIHACFHQAAGRLEKRLRRYKRRLRNHHEREREPAYDLMAQNRVLAAEPEETEEVHEEFQPVIVAEHTSEIHTRSVGEAVMELDLADAPVVMFRNGGNGHLNIVYRRNDGHVGWIDLVDDAK